MANRLLIYDDRFVLRRWQETTGHKIPLEEHPANPFDHPSPSCSAGELGGEYFNSLLAVFGTEELGNIGGAGGCVGLANFYESAHVLRFKEQHREPVRASRFVDTQTAH